jgi:hypothetical protein
MGARFIETQAATGATPFCICCHTNPTDDEGTPLPMIEAEGVDVNYGDNLYICQVCAGLLGKMVGQEDSEKVQALERGLKKLRTQVKTETTRREKAESLLARIKDGKAAVAEVRGSNAGS